MKECCHSDGRSRSRLVKRTGRVGGKISKKGIGSLVLQNKNLKQHL
jgi:hypothetical protein